jgi:hypothetical protein
MYMQSGRVSFVRTVQMRRSVHCTSTEHDQTAARVEALIRRPEELTSQGIEYLERVRNGELPVQKVPRTDHFEALLVQCAKRVIELTCKISSVSDYEVGLGKPWSGECALGRKTPAWSYR